MSPIRISLYEKFLTHGETLIAENRHRAVWLQEGVAQHGEHILNQGDGTYLGKQNILPSNGDCRILCFEVCNAGNEPHPQENAKLLLTTQFDIPHPEAILRLDQVTFPKSSIAYRHVHVGAGIRFPTKGQLEIRTDDNRKQMKPGSAWFEDANFAVTAITSATEETQFVRALVLSLEYEGMPTIKYQNPEDFEKPKLQKNHRFFDQRIRF